MSASNKKAIDDVRGKPERVIAPTLSFCAKSCGEKFSIATAREISIKSTWQSLPIGAHEQRTVLLLPGGDVFQTFNNKLQGSPKQVSVSNILPVRGSWIQQRGITGKFTVKVYLDNKLRETKKLTITR